METVRRVAPNARLLIATLWVGTIWAVGYIAAPSLFAHLDDRVLAGTLAGHLFKTQALISLSCGALLLTMLLPARDLAHRQRRTCLWLIGAMLACTLIVYLGLQPMMTEMRAQAGPGGVMESAMRARFGMLHGISALLQLAQALLGGWLILRVR